MHFRHLVPVIDDACQQARAGIVGKVVYSGSNLEVSITNRGEIVIVYTQKNVGFWAKLTTAVQARALNRVVEDAPTTGSRKLSFYPK